MSGDVMGGGVVIAIAAGLWIVYLVPTWLRRREYLTTERNAVRLQQTMRILAATSELPDEVRLEATARTVAEQQRILRRAQEEALQEARAAAHAQAAAERFERKRLAEESAARAAALAAQRPAPKQAERVRMTELLSARETGSADRTAGAVAVASRSRGLRRARALTSLTMLISLIALGFGVFSVLASGSWVLLACAGAVFVSSVLIIGRLAGESRRTSTAPVAVSAPVASELYDHGFVDDEVEVEAAATWTPQPLPKPLHLSRGTIAASAMASIDAAAELRRAAARADLERRAAELSPEPEVTPLRRAVPAVLPEWADAPSVPQRVEAAPRMQAAALAQAARTQPVQSSWAAAPERSFAAASRFASMGVVDADAPGAIDLDAALRRRRAAS